MANSYRTGILITGDASGAIRQIKLTDDELQKLNSTKGKSTTRARDLAREWGSVAKSVVKWGAGIAAAAVGVGVAVTKNVADSSREIQMLSNVANASTQEFQRWAVGAKYVGIEQEKLADILKDTQDKIGDFMSTGGGGMADFFENVAPKVGVTADQFRRLSGPDALQLYVSSLEKANLSQAEMTFYMEAVASDATALIPLLRNGGEEMERLGDRASELGMILDTETLTAASQLHDSMLTLWGVGRGFGNSVAQELLPVMNDITGLMLEYAETTREASEASGLLTDFFRHMLTGIIGVSAAVQIASNNLKVWSAGVGLMLQGNYAAGSALLQYDNPENYEILEDAIERVVKLWANAYQQSGEAAASVTRDFSIELDRTASEAARLAAETAKLAEVERRRTEKVALMTLNAEQSVDLLRREVEATRLGGEALEEFNRIKHVELGLRSANVDMLPEEAAAYRLLLEQQYDLQQQLADLSDEADEYAKRASPLAIVWERSIQRIDDSFADLFRRMVRDGKVAFDSLKDVALETVGEIAYTIARNRIILSLGVTGSSASAAASQSGSVASALVGSGGSNMSLLSMLSQGGSGALSVGGILTGAEGAFAKMGFQSGADFMYGLQESLANSGNMVGGGMGAGLAVNIGAGLVGSWAGGKLGEELFDKQAESSWGAGTGATVGSYFGPWGTLIGAAIGAIVDVATGSDGLLRRTLGVETDPNVRAGDRGMTDYQVRGASGLLFTGRNTRGDADVANSLADVFAATDTALTGIYEILTGHRADLDGQYLEGGSSQAGLATQDSGINSFFGSAEFNQLSEEALRGATDSFVRAWVEQVNRQAGEALDIEPLFALQQEGELLAETLVRANNQLTIANATLAATGRQAYDVSVAGTLLADSLVQAFGSIDNLVASSEYYYQNFFTEQEHAQRLVEQYTNIIDQFNDEFGTAIAAKTDLRDYVDALDLTSQAGQEAYAAALRLAPALVGIDEAMSLLTHSAEAAVYDLGAIAQNITSMFGSTYESILLDGIKSEGERYDYFRSQADSIADLMTRIVDPREMEAAMSRYNALVGSAYGALSEENQDAMREGLLDTIQAVHDRSLEIIGAAPLPAFDQQQAMITELVGELHSAEQRRAQGDAELRQEMRQLIHDMGGRMNQFGDYVLRMPGSFNVQVTIADPQVGG